MRSMLKTRPPREEIREMITYRLTDISIERPKISWELMGNFSVLIRQQMSGSNGAEQRSSQVATVLTRPCSWSQG